MVPSRTCNFSLFCSAGRRSSIALTSLAPGGSRLCALRCPLSPQPSALYWCCPRFHAALPVRPRLARMPACLPRAGRCVRVRCSARRHDAAPPPLLCVHRWACGATLAARTVRRCARYVLAGLVFNSCFCLRRTRSCMRSHALAAAAAAVGEGPSPVPVQMWERQAQSRCRCGKGKPSPGADVGGVPAHASVEPTARFRAHTQRLP